MTQDGPVKCSRCESVLDEAALVCPQCHTLCHGAELDRLAERARAFAMSEDVSEERQVLERMLRFLPAAAAQHEAITRRQKQLDHQSRRPGMGKLAGLGAVAMLLWKFKFALVFLLSKGKLLLLGLTKAKTLFSMLFAMGAYWTIWGWPFAIGFVLSIYVHEMGHVAALRRLGIAASAPMFIPFVGAFVRLHQAPRSAREDAVIGLAGPVYGTAAALLCLGVHTMTGLSVVWAIARTGAWINLFNLIPVWQLDGGRGFNAMTAKQRNILTAVVAGAWFFSGENMLLLVLIGCAYRLFMTSSAEKPDDRATWTYGALVVVLTMLSQIQLEELAP